MTDPVAPAILDDLATVERERVHRAATPGLAARTLQLKTLQQDRFHRAYHDLLAHPRYGGAARFFLEELYGPRDFSRRDAQFQRIVRPLVRLFPSEVVQTVAQLTGQISGAAADQARDIGEVNRAIAQVDEITRQNTDLVAESAIACAALTRPCSHSSLPFGRHAR